MRVWKIRIPITTYSHRASTEPNTKLTVNSYFSSNAVEILRIWNLKCDEAFFPYGIKLFSSERVHFNQNLLWIEKRSFQFVEIDLDVFLLSSQILKLKNTAFWLTLFSEIADTTLSRPLRHWHWIDSSFSAQNFRESESPATKLVLNKK